MLTKQNYPIYRYCLFQTLRKHKDQLISIVGKVTSIDSQSQTLTLQVTPSNQQSEQAQSIKVIVPEFTVNYLFSQRALKKIRESEDLQQVEKFINKKNNVERLVVQADNTEERPYTSLTWFAVKQNNPELSSKEKEEQVQHKFEISASALINNITVDEFNVNQYIQVRGKCIDDLTVQMQQFTDLQQNYDLVSHNYALAFGLEYCSMAL